MTTWADLFERGATYEVDRERIRTTSGTLDGDDITDDADDTDSTDDTDDTGDEPATEDDDG